MRANYDRRAGEYDDWWLGTGRFATRDRPGWSKEVEQLARVIAALPPARSLDAACGTGFLTRHLRGEVTALDQSPGMLRLAGKRLPDARLVEGEAVPLPFADGAFERVLTAHFYGHLLPAERAAFLAEARRVGSELVVVDSASGHLSWPQHRHLLTGGPTAPPERAAEGEWQERELDDGSVHRVYKRFFTPSGLAEELGGGRVLHAGRWFVVVASP